MRRNSVEVKPIDVNSGKIVEEMFGAPVKTYFVTSLVEKNGKRYFMSILNPSVLVMDKEGRQEMEEPK